MGRREGLSPEGDRLPPEGKPSAPKVTVVPPDKRGSDLKTKDDIRGKPRNARDPK